MGRYREKLEKEQLKKISKDIKCIRNSSSNFNVSRTIKEIERYYKNNRFSEDILFYRIDKLETNLLFRDSIFSTFISITIGFIFTLATILENVNIVSSSFWVSVVYPTILTMIMLLFIILLTFDTVKKFSSKDGGRLRYISKKEIEIIINKIEESSKIKTKRNRRNGRYLKHIKN